ncbi:hypothetical protein [Singulisphaera sp. PoT]|uniref:hypothetical protein n=1 Tax=Singulisphaera sp. PoT TaxID=3411797 RepID=UPI003BF5CFB4
MPEPKKSKAELLLEAAPDLYPELSDFKHNGSEIVAKNGAGQTVFIHEDIVMAAVQNVRVNATPKP